jgi:hypothetical protein
VEKPVFKGGKTRLICLSSEDAAVENAGHVGYGAHAGPEKQPKLLEQACGASVI